MFLESLQLLCNAVPDNIREIGGGLRDGGGLFRPTHKHHPCTRWVIESAGNWHWLLMHANTLSQEYTLRFNRQHASTEVLRFLNLYQYNIRSVLSHPFEDMTPFAQAMPEEYRHENAVHAYRTYYRTTKTFAKYQRGRPEPAWWDVYAP